MTDWTRWESLVINGVFPLRHFLSRSNHSVVFLTESQAQNVPDAAIKLIPEPPLAEAQLSHWRAIAALSHPHLIRLFDAGHCELGGHPFLFVVMEYAEQTLAQILPHRPLSVREVREMLPPALDALAFLHGKNLVQGQVKPPNFLVVGDQLKLASDTVRPSGESTAGIAESSPYDPPEANTGGISAAADIWGLGATIVEALTQCLPSWPDANSETASLPATLPAEFVDTSRRCLRRNPAERPTINDLKAQVALAPSAPVASQVDPAPPPPVISQVDPAPLPPAASITRPVVLEAAGEATPTVKTPKKNSLLLTVAVLLVVLAAAWAGLHRLRSHAGSPQLPSSASQASLQRAAPPAAAPPNPGAAQNPKLPRSAPAFVLHQEIPDVPRSARDSIRGHIKVTVRVTVDRSGNVVGETLANPGSSKYFAHLAAEAAKKWKFASADNQESRVLLLRFEFTRAGTTGHAVAPGQ
jgi:serine/threonine protein kinase